MREPDQFFHAEGNRGGSQIHLIERPNGMVELRVAETCVHTVDQEISVAALAVILTWAKDRGFQAICDEYLAQGGGSPRIVVERDVASTCEECGAPMGKHNISGPLDEARINELKQQRDQHAAKVSELAIKLNEARTEIVRLRAQAPPSRKVHSLLPPQYTV